MDVEACFCTGYIFINVNKTLYRSNIFASTQPKAGLYMLRDSLCRGNVSGTCGCEHMLLLGTYGLGTLHLAEK